MTTASQTNKAKLVILFPDFSPEEKTLAENVFFRGNVMRVPFNKLGVSVTPYLFVADRFGVVTASWRGKLTSDQENEVLSLVE